MTVFVLADRVVDAVTSQVRSRPLLTLCLIGALVSFTGISNELWTPDEPRVAAIGRAMWESGSWVTPQLNGVLFPELLPLYWWAQAAVFALFGYATPTLARLPSAVFGFATLLFTYALGRRFFPKGTCLMAGLVLATMALFTFTTHWIAVDSALVCMTVGAWTLFVYGEDQSGARRLIFLLGMVVFLAMAFLTKGVFGLGIPVLGMGVYLLWNKRFRRFLGGHLVVGGALFATGVGLWLWALWREGGGAPLETFFSYNQPQRFFPQQGVFQEGHGQPIWYYLVSTPAHLLPWTPFVFLAGLWGWRNWRQIPPVQLDGLRFCLSGTLPVLIVLSLAGTKRGVYLLPIYPLIALLVGCWATAHGVRHPWEDKVERWWLLCLIALAALSPATLFLAPRIWPYGLGVLVSFMVFWCSSKGFATLARDARLLRAALLCTVAAGLLLMAGKPFLDRYKSYVPFVRELEKQSDPATPLYTYPLDETTLGLVGFYTGRKMKVVDLAELKALAGGGTTSLLIVRDRKKRDQNYGSIVEAGISHRVLTEQVTGNTRVMRIIALGGQQNNP